MKKLYFSLTLFDGAEGASGAEGVGGEVAAGTENLQGTENAEPQTEAPKEMSYKDFKEKFKDDFQKDFDNAFNKRHKEFMTTKETLNNLNPLLSVLCQKYGTSDYNTLLQAINEDDGFFEEAAEREGLTVEQYKKMQRLERENAEAMRIKAEIEAKAYQDNLIQNWVKEADKLKATYPDFDLNNEFENENFKQLLVKGVDVKTAYEVAHIADIKNAEAEKAKQEVVTSVQRNQGRPSENGLAGGKAVKTKIDVNKLTKQDRADILRRVAKGEKITFGEQER